MENIARDIWICSDKATATISDINLKWIRKIYIAQDGNSAAIKFIDNAGNVSVWKYNSRAEAEEALSNIRAAVNINNIDKIVQL